jgi:hypothetical protein
VPDQVDVRAPDEEEPGSLAHTLIVTATGTDRQPPSAMTFWAIAKALFAAGTPA